MNHQPVRQPALRNSFQPVSLPPRYAVTWQQQLSFAVLTLASLLLVNALFFAHIAHATPTPEPQPPVTPTSAPTSFLPTPTAAPAPPPQRFAVTWPNSLGLVAVAFGGLLLLSTVFFVRMPVANPRRRDEHDE